MAKTRFSGPIKQGTVNDTFGSAIPAVNLDSGAGYDGKQRNVGTSAATVHTSNSDDAIISVRCANTTTSTINIDVFINDGSNDYYLIKNAPIVSGGSLELIDGGSKIVMLNNDVLKAKSDTASSLDVWASFVDAIST